MASDNQNGNSLVDLNDEELLDIMEHASEEEEIMEEAFSEVVEIMLGDDDPEMIASVREITDALKSSDGSDDESTHLMQSMAKSTEKKIAVATGIASLDMISKSDD
mmetsp:Transcript_19462/g.35783  ORF Transcript_19462/g.35783 Transcript_19462/m.35783 type:complete len:106 (-) Transcript_19462:91-408(-)